MGAVLRAYMEELALARFSLASFKAGRRVPLSLVRRSCPSAIPSSDAPSHAHPR